MGCPKLKLTQPPKAMKIRFNNGDDLRFSSKAPLVDKQRG